MLFSYRVIFAVSSIVERKLILRKYMYGKMEWTKKKGKVGKALKSRWKAVQTPHECRIVCMVLTMNKQSGTA